MASTAWVGVVTGGANATTAEFDRISTSDPVHIAVDVARQIGDGSARALTDLIVTTSEQFADAIVSAGLTGFLDGCPRPDATPCRRSATVLTEADELPEVTSELIGESGVPAERITVLGGVTAVSEDVRNQIAIAAGWDGVGDNPVVRLAGATRYDTAAAIAGHVLELADLEQRLLPVSYRTVVVATGENPSDALVASALAYRGGHLLLLSPRSTPPAALDEAIDVLDANCAVMVGGTTALTTAIETHLESVLSTTGAGACGVERIAGLDRHDTAVQVAERMADEFAGPTTVILANPRTRALPLTAAPLTRIRSALLYTGDDDLATRVRTWLGERAGIGRITVVGGVDDIARTVAAAAVDVTNTSALRLPPPPAAPVATGISLTYASTEFDTTQTSQVLAPSVTGGTGPYSYAITSGSLPPGVLFDSATGTFTGPGTWDLGFVTVSAGRYHTCAVATDMTARCWGNGGNGKLGNGTSAGTQVHPVAVLASGTQAANPVTLSGVTQISAGASHTCALLVDTTARCWGSGYNGLLGNGEGAFIDQVHPVAVLASGTQTSNPVTLSGITQISAGDTHTCALLVDTTARCWGEGTSGRLGNGEGAFAGQVHPVAVLASGTRMSSPVTLSGITQISAGVHHTCAVLIDGTARCWGSGVNGRLGDGTTNTRLNPVAVLSSGTQASSPAMLNGVVEISAAATWFDPTRGFTCARLVDSTARCWGYGQSGQLGDGLGASSSPHPLAVLLSGTHGGSPVTLSGVVSIAAGDSWACAVMSDETARCWGSGVNGQLGDGRSSYSVHAAPVLESGTPTSSPVTLSAVSSLSTGYLQTCVVRTNGEIRCSGYSQWGLLGDGTVNTTRRNPVRVLASGTELSSPVPFGGSISVAPATITVEVTDSGASSSSVTVTLTSR